MNIGGIQSTTLAYANAAVANATDSSSIEASEEATKTRHIHAILLASSIWDLTAPDAAAQDRYRCNVQVGYNGQANGAGVLGNLQNAVNVTQQGTVTAAPASNNGSQNVSITFANPLTWNVGVTINMRVGLNNVNAAAATCQVECAATIVYTD